MKLVIDVREQALIHEIKQDAAFDIALEIKQLELGDIILYDDNDEIKVMIERKTPSDLMSSIKDGRYKEQSLRLSSIPLHNHYIIYMIEGNIYAHRDCAIIQSALYSLYFYKGFSIWHSNNVKTTKQLIYRFAKKMAKEGVKDGFYTISESSENNEKVVVPTDYISCIKSVKKDNITADNIHHIMLSQVPHVSAQTSKAILSKYSTIFDVKRALEEDEHCLDNITQTCSGGKERKISSLAIKNIQKLL